MVNILEYDVGVPAEDLSKYCPGGYHPIRLNDTLHDGRYEIVHKLDFGAFSTVWLARDNHHQRNVTIKVVVASKSDETTRELAILQALKDRGNPAHPGHKHVTHFIDSFHIEGPNGRHLCIVLDLLGPKVSSVTDGCEYCRLDAPLAHSISRQLLLAVDYLHSVGVAHGDIHLGNVLFRVPELETLSTELLLEELGPPEIGKVERRDGAPLEPGVPEYLVEPVEYYVDVHQHPRDVELIDFGESFFIADPPQHIFTPLSLHPPELVLQRPLTQAVDIWNLGSTTFELVTGGTPFEAWYDDQDLVPQFAKVLGGLPQEWVEDAVKKGALKAHPEDSSAENFLSLEGQIRRSYFRDHDVAGFPLREADLDKLGRYLRRLLVVDASQRATAHDLLKDPWVVEEVEGETRAEAETGAEAKSGTTGESP